MKFSLENQIKLNRSGGARLNYQGTHGKDTFDCLLCSTVMYEIERAIQAANVKSAEERQKKLEEKKVKSDD